VAVSGSSGLIGGELSRYFSQEETKVIKLVRAKAESGGDCVLWDPESKQVDAAGLEDLDAVIHLAGENIATRRWSPEQKEIIRKSRVEGTRLLSETLAGLKKKPKVFLCASAVGYYGDRSEPVDESSDPGLGFLPELCRDWEAAAEAASAAGIRVVHLRIGVVLSPRGGALKKMLLPFKMGVGGPVGDGRQPMPWIAIDDVIRAIDFLMRREELSGAFNITAPEGGTNAAFGKALGRVLGRPAVIPLPAIVVKMMFGEMGKALLLGGAPVIPKRLQEAGFHFKYRSVEEALRGVLSSQ
jgi:uncharacterized protein (TIGR01777 family)